MPVSGELVSLHMLVIAVARSDHELWHQSAAMASVPLDIIVVQDAASAQNVLAKGGMDICIVDANLSDADKAMAVAAARASKSLVFVAGPHGSKRVAGADGVLKKPANADDARKLVEICIRVKLPTRVLIVDDSSTMRSIVRKILAASRFTLDVHEAAEGFAALKQLRGATYGLVFLDYNMPGFNGFETMSEIKRECPNTSVVMMTSATSDAVAERAYSAGVLAFLRKPFYPADIDAILERHFGLNG